MLGRVDGFDDDEAKSECDEGCKVLVRFLATERKALEALELAHKLLDTGAGSIECLREERWPVLGRCLERDHWADATLARGRAIGFGIIAFVPHSRAGRDVGPKIKQDLKLRAVAGLTLCEVKREGASIQISLEVDLGREPAARAAQRVTLLPPLYGAHYVKRYLLRANAVCWTKSGPASLLSGRRLAAPPCIRSALEGVLTNIPRSWAKARPGERDP